MTETVDDFYGITVATTYVVGASAGRTRRTGTKRHRCAKRTVVASTPELAISPPVLDGRLRFRVGDVLEVRPVCGSADRATEVPGAGDETINCERCPR